MIKPDQIEEEDWKAFQEEMRGRSIRPTEGHDVLRWGYLDKGVFNIKEAYKIWIRNDVEFGELWKNISMLNLWPKVATFAWLMVKSCILTGENLRKHGL